MRVLFVSKRQYTGRDALDDAYGRLYEIPRALAALGHSVEVAFTSYRSRAGASVTIRDRVRWSSADMLPVPHRPFGGWAAAIARFAPDVLVASSDALHLAAAEFIGSRLGIPVVLDFYDDYEAFGLSRVPGLRWALRRASRRARCVVAVTQTLRAQLISRGVQLQRVTVIGNGIPGQFVPSIGKVAARQALGLPLGVPLVGSAGSLSSARGVQDLIQAHERLLELCPDVHLCLAGPRDGSVRLTPNRRFIDLGVLPHQDVALLWKALDVGVVYNRVGAFSEACHPMKLVEMVACGLPVIAAEIGEVASLLSMRPDALYPPGDSTALASRMQCALLDPRPLDPAISQPWTDLARQYETVLLRAISSRG
ncbi:glycosyltransferase [Pseudomarimonas salicorniae]|uniref:Glycosyltransferase n=1 Tax=Pseudomarimonas salicorniae TaxID=2933270 RepID=A0ABT0GFL2_9GAMM|nr:glycosyltransferase [Lysobacter sp. CAU 1642]MCK7593330.1 glycosyltransferase [Lysobacter sp. CAU 1642]